MWFDPIITKLSTHEQMKPLILEQIDMIPRRRHDQISKSDWALTVRDTDYEDTEYHYNYREIFLDGIQEHVDHVSKTLWCEGLEINPIWFQQYTKNNNHEWHTHGNCQLSTIYYCELPNKEYRTQWFDIRDESIHDFEVEEGDMVSFPSWLIHRSPPINSFERKTVVVFNANLSEVSYNRIGSGRARIIRV